MGMATAMMMAKVVDTVTSEKSNHRAMKQKQHTYEPMDTRINTSTFLGNKRRRYHAVYLMYHVKEHHKSLFMRRPIHKENAPAVVACPWNGCAIRVGRIYSRKFLLNPSRPQQHTTPQHVGLLF